MGSGSKPSHRSSLSSNYDSDPYGHVTRRKVRTNGDPSPAISRPNSRPLSYPPASDRVKPRSAQISRMPLTDIFKEFEQIPPSSKPVVVHADVIEETAAPMAPAAPPDDFSAENIEIIYDDMADVEEQQSPSTPSTDLYQAEHLARQGISSDRGYRKWVRRQRREVRRHQFSLRNLHTRAVGYEKRSKLRESRLRISAADEAFMKQVRSWWTEVASDQEKILFQESYDRLQATRDAHGPLEEAYNELEDQLDREEYELTVLGEQITKHGTRSYEEEQDNDWQSLSSSSSDANTISSRENLFPLHTAIGPGDQEIFRGGSSLAPSEAIEESNPLYIQFLSKQGEEDLLLEAHDELITDYERLQDIQEIRQRHGTDLLPEDQEIINNFPAKKAHILEQLREVREEVERLRQACIREGLLGEDIPDPPGSDIDLDADILENQDGYIDMAEYARFPLLLEKPEDKEDLKESKSLISTFKLGDKGDRITRWLLHKLRSSCSEVELLARCASDQEGLGTDPDDSLKWQEEVLEFWFVDDANLSTSEYEFEPSTYTPPPLSPPVIVALPPPLHLSPLVSPALIALPPSPLPSRAASLHAFPCSSYDLALTEGTTLVAGSGAPPLAKRAPTLVDFATAHKIHLVVRSSPRSERLEFRLQLQLKRRRHGSYITV